MKISRVIITLIDVPLLEPFVVSYATYDSMPSVILTLETDDGAIGYGESVPDAHITGETPAGVALALETELIPAILGMDPRDITAIHQQLDRTLRGCGAAKAAVDIACWDLAGKAAGRPVYALLGGRRPQAPTIAKVMSILAPGVLAEQAVQARSQGYRQLKMKLGGNDGLDIERVRAVRAAINNDLDIRVDANQGWSDPATARDMIRALEPYRIDWVEQPLRAGDIDGFRLLRQDTTTRLMADESVIDADDLARFVSDRSVDMVNLKLMKSGGITPCHRLATQAELGGLKVQIGSMLETSIASAAGFHLAVSHPNIVSTELSGPVKFTKEPGNLQYLLPEVQLTEGPGLGIDVDLDILAELTVSTRQISR
ncbi:mandelate racemase/muconate lactonizing enzyme family protein [Paeniglutamicibacter cryotolerans]|uniref:Dipeptide epimerase n=1 Tax=Paeniglutamicibacter cryotolerans TaxID=670079 RepID=A0A839QLD9_9MICC|nr:dipeptide epimerase [Paeniglutamicibacter cryotolerans]MBB2993992.1 L-alanine-DL-glutamate epimerase-like enolase superfamily enzyme [Paeniglutamicibacter cryotolerans]